MHPRAKTTGNPPIQAEAIEFTAFFDEALHLVDTLDMPEDAEVRPSSHTPPPIHAVHDLRGQRASAPDAPHQDEAHEDIVFDEPTLDILSPLDGLVDPDSVKTEVPLARRALSAQPTDSEDPRMPSVLTLTAVAGGVLAVLGATGLAILSVM